MRRGGMLLAAILALVSAPTLASSGNCWIDAGEKHGVDPYLLYAISEVESDGRVHAVADAGDTHSVGIMQVNSQWFPALEERGIDKEDLWEACTNIHAGAWILAQEIERYGATWYAVGAYYAGALPNKAQAPERHARKLEHYRVYTAKVKARLGEILRGVGAESRASQIISDYHVDVGELPPPADTMPGDRGAAAVAEVREKRRRSALMVTGGDGG
ncbi:transglycosylase SLT domain-containing protein [Arhodomonas sp. AD133]|uniref:lytic transglycosylase domain-containing protein n=1 Tax=Arhodomonas sp. AD133 TaxID=3415009 RepID=UPI003EBC8EA1